MFNIQCYKPTLQTTHRKSKTLLGLVCGLAGLQGVEQLAGEGGGGGIHPAMHRRDLVGSRESLDRDLVALAEGQDDAVAALVVGAVTARECLRKQERIDETVRFQCLRKQENIDETVRISS